MFWTSPKEEARRRLQIEQQLEILRVQERRKKAREAERAARPWWRKHQILAVFLCFCGLIYVLGGTSDNQKAAAQAAAASASEAEPNPMKARPAAAKPGDPAVMEDYSLGCRTLKDLQRLRGLAEYDPNTVIAAKQNGLCADIYKWARVLVIDNKSSPGYTLIRPEAGKGTHYWVPSLFVMPYSQYFQKHGPVPSGGIEIEEANNGQTAAHPNSTWDHKERTITLKSNVIGCADWETFDAAVKIFGRGDDVKSAGALGGLIAGGKCTIIESGSQIFTHGDPERLLVPIRRADGNKTWWAYRGQVLGPR